MRTLGAFSVLLALLFIAFVLAIGQPPQRPGGDKPGAGQDRRNQGRMGEAKREELRERERPRDTPPPGRERPQPPRDRGDHHWGLHPRFHRWVLVPRTVVLVQGQVIPPTYQLPDRVTYYEYTTACQLVCPNCGDVIDIHAH